VDICVCASPYHLLGNGSVKNITAAMNTSNNRRTVGRVVFFAVRVVSDESRRLVLPRTSSLINLWIVKRASERKWNVSEIRHVATFRARGNKDSSPRQPNAAVRESGQICSISLYVLTMAREI
jgi:hypothetical protein